MKNEQGAIIFLNSGAEELKSIHTLQKLIMNEFLSRHSYKNINNVIEL